MSEDFNVYYGDFIRVCNKSNFYYGMQGYAISAKGGGLFGVRLEGDGIEFNVDLSHEDFIVFSYGARSPRRLGGGDYRNGQNRTETRSDWEKNQLVQAITDLTKKMEEVLGLSKTGSGMTEAERAAFMLNTGVISESGYNMVLEILKKSENQTDLDADVAAFIKERPMRSSTFSMTDY